MSALLDDHRPTVLLVVMAGRKRFVVPAQASHPLGFAVRLSRVDEVVDHNRVGAEAGYRAADAGGSHRTLGGVRECGQGVVVGGQTDLGKV